MRRFRRLTLRNTIIVGRETLATFPDGKPLAGRANIVLSAKGLAGVNTVPSVEVALEMVRRLGRGTYVVGGQQVYEAFLTYCGEAYVTRIDADYDADRFFPPLDKLEGWRLAKSGEWREYAEVRYRYETWERGGIK